MIEASLAVAKTALLLGAVGTFGTVGLLCIAVVLGMFSAAFAP